MFLQGLLGGKRHGLLNLLDSDGASQRRVYEVDTMAMEIVRRQLLSCRLSGVAADNRGSNRAALIFDTQSTTNRPAIYIAHFNGAGDGPGVA